MLKDETSRHNYYLQLKYNALQREIPREYADQSMIMLAALALQADLGDAPAITTKTNNTKAIDNHQQQQQQSQEEQDQIESSDSNKTNNNSAALNSKFKLGTNLTTTLPKISKRSASSNERMLRLSTYVANTSKHLCLSNNNGREMSNASLSTASSNSSLNQSSKLTAAAESSKANLHNEVDYFRIEDYLPVGLRSEWAANALRGCHREHRGLSAADAELQYIQQAAMVHESINAHNFRMRLSKSEAGPGNSCFVVYAKGIKIYGNLNANEATASSSGSSSHGSSQRKQQQVATFLWPNITKLSFERKKFEIRTEDSKITLYANSDEKNKMLLTLCRETHQFSMKLAARLKDVLLKREQQQQAQLVDEDSNCLHACYSYSRSLHLPPYKTKNDQRISVISSTSSNTTSGIVSDRVHSEDELEIMINTPPAPIAAPSTESLALAHLLDRPSVSRQTSSVGQVSLKELEEQLAALSVRQAKQSALSAAAESESNTSPVGFKRISAGGNSSSSGSAGSLPNNNATQRNATDSSNNTDSPQSQHNIGSQCSSTCSTVVVATSSSGANDSMALSSGLTNSAANAIQRRNSTSSSLELGFSHTTQNSTLSEAESVNRAAEEESESVSGMYTLGHGAPPTETSGVYTMHSSEMTEKSSEIAESEKNSHYGLFDTAKSEISDDHLLNDMPQLDAVDGRSAKLTNRLKNEEFRLRSDSNISTSGSFRGDGSDPTDNKHTLLTAKELTELIVGRGTYPNRKTVSRTLDSDSDYVTLPLSLQQAAAMQEDQVEDLLSDLLPIDPPAPPKRIDSNAVNEHATLSNIRMRSPPPYNGRHETTGLCGPPVRTVPSSTAAAAATVAAVTNSKKTKTSSNNSSSSSNSSLLKNLNVPSQNCASSSKICKDMMKSNKSIEANAAAAKVALRRRDPPPYPMASKPRPTSLVSVSSAANVTSSANVNAAAAVGGSMTSLKSEEVQARFITTRPQINILKAHTSVLNDNPKPSYAAPTNCSSAASSTGSSLYGHNMASHLSQHSVHNSNYVSGSQASLNLSVQSSPAAGIIPVVPYGLHATHKSMSNLQQYRQHHSSHHHHHHQQQPPPPPPPYPDLKQPTRTACVLLPVIKPRQFLPPPPPSLPRQPPPPPPAVYAAGGHLECKQLELYQQQMYSDVDYVIYPIQDPAVSQQEYLDAKQGSLLAAMAQAPPPHPYLAYHHSAAAAWDSFKGHTIYRSTPYLPLALSTHSRYASTQNLSDTYVQLPSAYSPLYSPSMASLCSSYEPPPPPPLHPASFAVNGGNAAAAAAAANSTNYFARSRSDDNILNSLDNLPKVKRLPPPPPPPYVNRRLKKPPMPAPLEQPPPSKFFLKISKY